MHGPGATPEPGASDGPLACNLQTSPATAVTKPAARNTVFDCPAIAYTLGSGYAPRARVSGMRFA